LLGAIPGILRLTLRLLPADRAARVMERMRAAVDRVVSVDPAAFGDEDLLRHAVQPLEDEIGAPEAIVQGGIGMGPRTCSTA
jgi:hypothetical protein